MDGRAAALALRRLTHRSAGWNVVGALAVTETISWGIIYYGFAVFLRPMELGLHASRVAITGALSAALAASALAALPAGRWLDRYGPRLLMTGGSGLASVLVFAWARVESAGALYAVWSLMGVAMAATLYEPAFAAVVQRFPEQRERDRALLAVTLVAGLASTIFMPLSAWLLERVGWRTALELLAAFLAATTVPIHALALRPAPRQPDPAPSAGPGAAAGPGAGPRPAAPGAPLSAALATPAFWILAAAIAVGVFATVTVSVHMIPYLMQHGYQATYAAAVVGWIGAMQIPGRLLFAPIAAWFGARTVTAAVFLVQGLAMAVLPLALHPAGVVPVIILLGATNGMATLVRATIVAELFGRGSYGSISGAIAVGANGARALGPVGASLLRVWLGGYERLFWALAASLGAAGVTLLIAERPRGRRRSGPRGG
jgi:MFS family permease